MQKLKRDGQIGTMAAALVLLSTQAGTESASAQTGLTIYNQNFAVVRQTVPLRLQRGENNVTFNGTTSMLEPDSVVLRDPSGKRTLRVLEQFYRADALSQERLLALFEGKTIDFLTTDRNGVEKIVQGKIIRSGGNVSYNPYNRSEYSANVPIIEVDGKLRFSLPGIPLFPNLGDDTILKPSLNWKLFSDAGATFDAELAYVTGGMVWKADYNIVAPENENALDLTGWVTLTNNSGKVFDNTRIQLIAGDVNKIQQNYADFRRTALENRVRSGLLYDNEQVTQKDFDEYHLYTLPRPTTLRDRETKQVEFARATRIPSKLIYVYQGWAYRGDMGRNTSRDYGTQSNKKISVMREFVNSEANGLGIPLPAGRVRFYRREDATGALQFTGENTIDHTPQGETVRLYTGDSFDLVGERKQTNFEELKSGIRESFEITLRNRKKVPVEIKVVEKLYRWSEWKITSSSQPYEKTDSRTIEFKVPVAPNQEKKVTYTVEYSW